MRTFKKSIYPFILVILLTFTITSCVSSIANGAKVIQNFDAEKYMGNWYEIARFDSPFERNLDQVTSIYSLKKNGKVKMENRGFDYKNGIWKEAVSEARFVKSPKEAMLFRKPLWKSYNVIDIDEDYKYSLVVGNDLEYLWIFSREKTIPDSYKQRFLDKAKSLGFKTENLIWVNQD